MTIRTVRGIALAAATAFVSLGVLAYVLLATDTTPTTVGFVFLPIAGGALFLVATWRWYGAAWHAARILGWVAMALGLYGLVSFSFVVAPLLLLALPAVFVPGRLPRSP